MASRGANRVFWMLIGVASLLLVVGVPYLHAVSKAAFTKANVKQDEALGGATQGGTTPASASPPTAEAQRQVIAPLYDEFFGQFLHSAAVLTITAGVILAIAFYVRYQVGAAKADSVD